MYCQKCGSEIDVNAMFCQKCGASVSNDAASDSSTEFKWAWIVMLIIMALLPLLGQKSESFAYGIGYALGGFAIGWIGSPLAYLFYRFVLKKRWKWFHWFNAASGLGFFLCLFALMVS